MHAQKLSERGTHFWQSNYLGMFQIIKNQRWIRDGNYSKFNGKLIMGGACNFFEPT